MGEQIVFEKTVSFLLAKVTTVFRNTLERRMAVISLHSGQVFLLLELWKQDELRQVDLAERLGLSAPTVNKMLKGLIEINLVTRRRLDDDARSTRICLTKTGLLMRRDVEAQWLEMDQTILAGLTATEQLVLPDLLGKLRNILIGKPAEDEDE